MTRRDFSVKVGYAPTRRTVFSREDALRHKTLVERRLREWGFDLVNIEGINEDGLLFDRRDVPAVVERFCAAGVDAIFCPHCNFGTEDAVALLGKELPLPLLLWGPRDEAPLPDGTRLRDTQCGMLATSKILQRLGVPFSYIVNCALDDPLFERGFRNFVAAAAVVREFRRLRIGQVGTRPGPFWTVICNEGELLSRFGIQVVPVGLGEMLDRARAVLSDEPELVRETVQRFARELDLSAVDSDAVERMAALYLALGQWAEEEELSALCIQCWSALQDAFGIMPCYINGVLTGEGLPVACETDIHGAITAALAQAARLGETPTFFADLTIRHPTNENAELLWHCGVFPLSLRAEGEEPKMAHHPVLPDARPGTVNCRIRGGEISIVRFDGEGGQYKLFCGHARGTDGPATHGTYVWVEVDDWPKWEAHLARGPYIHHVVGIHGHVAPVLYEACRYLPGVQFDSVSPTPAEIEAWLRGADL